MSENKYPARILNWIDGQEHPAVSDEWFDKLDPHSGQVLGQVARSRSSDVEQAIQVAVNAQPGWADVPPVERGLLLHELVKGLQIHQDEIANIVAAETGKSYQSALGEVGGAAQCGLFYASEGQRLYARTTTSGVRHKYAMTIRQPVGVAGLIIAANTPIANVAWKIFPALICGNSVVLKAAEDTPATAWIVGRIAKEVGLPDGVLNIIQGFGEEAGAPLVEHPDVGVISFTGSASVGRNIQVEAGKRLAKVSLELGGKNPMVVCDDADLENAAKWVLLSAFSNAGQRCASGSRIIIFDEVYDEFRQMLVDKTQELSVGPTDDDDFGPVINERQLKNMVSAIEAAKGNGAKVLCGGFRLEDPEHKNGYYLAPTMIEGSDPKDDISCTELFGPIANLYRVIDFAEALALSNDSPYGLTASIHTRSIHRAVEYSQKVHTGVAVVNAGTFGSEPHMPFGGVKNSGNGWREPGTEALDIYSELKDIYININPDQL